MNFEDNKWLRIDEVVRFTRLSITTIYRRGDNGTFPQRVKVNKINRWVASEIYEWIKRKPVHSSHDEWIMPQLLVHLAL
jgi:predicted DNA-binding transcriptional regulator AlpA